MAINIGSAIAYLELDSSGFVNSLSSASKELKNIKDETSDTGSKLNSVQTLMAGAGSALTKNVTLPLVGVGTAAVKVTADFDSSMSKVKALSGATGQEFDDLRDKAREMGSKTKFSATEAADAMTYMAMAGWETEDMLQGIDGIMNLAEASGEDLATTSDIVTDALTAFGLSAKESGHFADVLAQVSASANTNVSMLGETFKYVAPVAGAMGYTVEDVALVTGLMANAGIKASSAGTQLRTSITNMIKPTKQIGDEMEKLGFYATETITTFEQQDIDKQMLKVEKQTLSVEKAQHKYNETVLKYGSESIKAQEAAQSLSIAEQQLIMDKEKLEALQNGETKTVRLYNMALQNEDRTMKTLSETIDFLRVALKDKSVQEKEAALVTIFGKEAMAGMSAVINASAEDYDELTTDILNADGAAEQMAETMRDNLSGQLTILMSGLSELAITIGDALMPYIRALVGWIQSLVDWLNNLDPTTKTIIVTIGTLVAAVGPVLLIVAKIISAITTIQSIIPVISGALTGLGGVIGALINPITLVIAAIGAIGAALIYLWNNCDEFREGVINIFNKVVDFFQELPEKILAFFQMIVDGIVSFFENIVSFVGEKTEIFVTTIIEGVKKLPDKFKNITKQVYNGVISWGKNMISKAKETGKKFVENVSDNMKNLGSKIKEKTDTAFNNVKNFASDMKSKATEIGKNFVDNARTKLSGLSGMLSGIFNESSSILSSFSNVFYSIGSNVLSNLWNGMSNIAGSIINWISGFANTISNTVSNILGFFRSIISGANDANRAASSVRTRNAKGMDYIPYDGYLATLHRGEAILTAQENEERKTGKDRTAGGDTFNFYNTKPNPYQYAKQIKKAKREILYGF